MITDINGKPTTEVISVLEALWALSGAWLAPIIWQVWRRHKARQNQVQWEARLPAHLNRLAAQMASGSPLDSAMPEFSKTVGYLSAQVHSATGARWSQLLAQHPHEDIRLLGRLVSLYETQGSDLSSAIQALAQRLNQRQRAISLARIAMAPVMGQARLLLIVMPALVGMVGLFEPQATLLLFTTYSGLAVILGCVVLNATMWAIFRNIARRAL